MNMNNSIELTSTSNDIPIQSSIHSSVQLPTTGSLALDSQDHDHHDHDPVIHGYLYKKTRDGRWQKRWFETNGMYLTYYKTKKMEKLLAALSLPQVGEIALIKPKTNITLNTNNNNLLEENMFTIELNSRIYILRANTIQEAENWVKTLSILRDKGTQMIFRPSSIVISQDMKKVKDVLNENNISNIQMNSLNKELELSSEKSNPTTSWMKSQKFNLCCCWGSSIK